jgi:putative cell wall-binding protein
MARRRIQVALIAVVALASLVSVVDRASASTTRIAGANRYETSAAISAAFFSPGVTMAFLATGENFPDALAGVPIAAFWGAPILLVGRDELPAAVDEELARLRPSSIVVLGGTGSVSEQVASAAGRRTTGQVVRIAGSNRYETAASISENTFRSGADVVHVASGTSFADALAGGPAAAVADGPVLLVDHDSVPEATAAELGRLAPDRIVVLGGEAAVSSATAQQLRSFAPVTRRAGNDRYDTAAAVSAGSFGRDRDRVFVATGAAFPDALAAGAAAAATGAPIILSKRTCTPRSVATELGRLSASDTIILGGEAAVSGGALSTTCAGTDSFRFSDVPFQPGSLTSTYFVGAAPQVAKVGRFSVTATYSNVGIQVARRDGSDEWEQLPPIGGDGTLLYGMDVLDNGDVVLAYDDGGATSVVWSVGDTWWQPVSVPPGSGLVRIAGDIYLWSNPEDAEVGDWEVAGWNGFGFGPSRRLLEPLPPGDGMEAAARYIHKWMDTADGAVFFMREYEPYDPAEDVTRSEVHVVTLGDGATVVESKVLERRSMDGLNRLFSTGVGLGVGRNGEIAAVWTDRDPHDFPYNPEVLVLYAMRGRDGSWSAATPITPERHADTDVLGAAVADDGKAYAFWDGPNDCGFMCVNGAQLTPTSSRLLGEHPFESFILELVPAANGVHALWTNIEGACSPGVSCTGVFEAISVSDAGWGQPRRVATQPVGFNHVVVRDGLWALNIDPDNPRVVVAERDVGPL